MAEKVGRMIAEAKALPPADLATPEGKRNARDKRNDLRLALKLKRILLKHAAKLERSVENDPLMLAVDRRRRATTPKTRPGLPVFEFEMPIDGTMFHLTARALTPIRMGRNVETTPTTVVSEVANVTRPTRRRR